MPKILSIITINYNHLNGLVKTCNSVIPQRNINEVEWIVIDGNSTDGSVDYIKQNADQFDSIVIESDKGIYDAMNKGLHKCTGEYVWFLNSGDSVHGSNTISGVVNAIKNSAADIIFGDTMFVNSEGKEIGLISKLKPQPLTNKLVAGSFRFGMNVCHQSFIAKRSICPDYNTNYRYAADVNWIIDILRQNPSSQKTDFIISNFEIGGSSYQHTNKAWKERFGVLSEQYGLIPNILAHGWIVIRRVLFNLKLKLRQ